MKKADLKQRCETVPANLIEELRYERSSGGRVTTLRGGGQKGRRLALSTLDGYRRPVELVECYSEIRLGIGCLGFREKTNSDSFSLLISRIVVGNSRYSRPLTLHLSNHSLLAVKHYILR